MILAGNFPAINFIVDPAFRVHCRFILYGKASRHSNIKIVEFPLQTDNVA